MRNLVKNSALFIFLSLVFSGLTGCSNPGGSPSNTGSVKPNDNAQVTNAVNSNSQTDTSNSEYPLVSPTIMQADLKSVDGTTFKLEDYKGKVIVVNFWATWCGPCIAEMPQLINLREANKEKGFEIIGVNSDPEDDFEGIKAFAEKKKLTYRVAQSEREFFEPFLKISKFPAIPQSFLIDREGRLRGVFVGGNKKTMVDLKDNVEKLLSAN